MCDILSPYYWLFIICNEFFLSILFWYKIADWHFPKIRFPRFMVVRLKVKDKTNFCILFKLNFTFDTMKKIGSDLCLWKSIPLVRKTNDNSLQTSFKSAIFHFTMLHHNTAQQVVMYCTLLICVDLPIIIVCILCWLHVSNGEKYSKILSFHHFFTKFELKLFWTVSILPCFFRANQVWGFYQQVKPFRTHHVWAGCQ